MSIDSQIVTVGIFFITQALSLIWTVSTLKGDARVLKAHMESMQKEISGVQKTLDLLADVKGEMKLMNERGLLQGKRLDDVQSRINRWLDRAEPNG